MNNGASASGLAGRHVLVTGGAGGLGAPAVEQLLALGANVTVIDVNEASRIKLEASLDAGQRARFAYVHQDLGAPEAVAAVVRRLADERTVDVLVNMAAIYPSKALGQYSLEEFAAVQTINTTAAFACAQGVLPGMAAQGWGRIINISSITFYGGWANISPYVTSKGALIGLTRAIAREFGPQGVTANAICPGAFPTEAESIQGDAEAYTAFVLERQSIKRRGRPDDFANLLVFLASEQSSFITGQSLNLDGGWFMH